jgi:uncharacterized protein
MIKNNSDGQVIIEKHKVCKSLFSKATGLMFRKKADYALVFEFNRIKRISLTNYFVLYPIDVLWLDSSKRVVEVKQGFRPFTNYTPKALALYVVELPQGRARKIRIGDELAWE